APVLALERLDALARAASEHVGAVRLTPALLADLGWKTGQAEAILRALDFAPARKADAESNLWRRRASAAKAPSWEGHAVSPFAALAPLVRPAASPARRARPKKRRLRAASGGVSA
ncbi:MAG: hypothetical protein WAU78_17415, partial [Roseiarcus sp.]